jgi:peptide deformylase
MSVFKILNFPNPILKKKARDLKLINNDTLLLIDNLIETMLYYDALGIAATQIGVHEKIIIINMSNNYISQPLVIINPKILSRKGISINEEGCLSFPNVFMKIKRNKNIYIKFNDISGYDHFLKIDSMLSICLQHEIDHLNGITIYDRVSNFKKKYILKNML